MSDSSYIPVSVSALDPIVAGGEIMYRVTMNQAASTAQTLTCSCSTTGVYTDLPSTVEVPAYQSYVEFTATLSMTLPPLWTLSVTGGGVSVSTLEGDLQEPAA
jgi:hypothetical protein